MLQKKSHTKDECWSLKNKNKNYPRQYQNPNRFSNQSKKSAICSQGSANANTNKNRIFEKKTPNDRNAIFFVGDNVKDLWVID